MVRVGRCPPAVLAFLRKKLKSIIIIIILHNNNNNNREFIYVLVGLDISHF